MSACVPEHWSSRQGDAPSTRSIYYQGSRWWSKVSCLWIENVEYGIIIHQQLTTEDLLAIFEWTSATLHRLVLISITFFTHKVIHEDHHLLSRGDRQLSLDLKFYPPRYRHPNEMPFTFCVEPEFNSQEWYKAYFVVSERYYKLGAILHCGKTGHLL